MSEVKQPTTYKEQIEKIKSRGCVVSDEELCEKLLSQIGYYRLSAYFLPFRKKDGSYKPGLPFEQVYNLYEFDRKLRSIIGAAIEVTEVNLRSTLTYFHSHKYGALGYLDPTSFNQKHNATKFDENIKREIKNNSDVLFVKHHIENYDSLFPLWVIGELFSFGMWSYFYSDLKTADKKQFAGVKYNLLVSWLRCCTDLRNICAHSGRLYYRVFSAVPAGLTIERSAERRLWGALLALKELYPSSSKWNCEVLVPLESLFEQYADSINLYHIAFPRDWNTQLLKTNELVFDSFK